MIHSTQKVTKPLIPERTAGSRNRTARGPEPLPCHPGLASMRPGHAVHAMPCHAMPYHTLNGIATRRTQCSPGAAPSNDRGLSPTPGQPSFYDSQSWSRLAALHAGCCTTACISGSITCCGRSIDVGGSTTRCLSGCICRLRGRGSQRFSCRGRQSSRNCFLGYVLEVDHVHVVDTA